MDNNRILSGALALAGIALLIGIAVLIVENSKSRGVINIDEGNRTAVMLPGGNLSLSWLYKVYYKVTRDGDEVLVDGGFATDRYKLCGVGCTVEVPIGSSKLKVTENNDGSLTITWPKYYHMY